MESSIYLIGVLINAPIILFNWNSPNENIYFVDKKLSTFTKLVLISLSWLTVGFIILYLSDLIIHLLDE